MTNLLPQQVDSLLRAKGVRLVKRNSIRFMDVFIDNRQGPLARVEVRRALLHGTDVEGLVRYIARGNGHAIATVTLPEDFGFNASLKPYTFDPAKARALLAEAGYPAGFRLQGLATHDTQTLATALAQQWAKIGVKLEVAVEGRAPTMSRWIKERDRHDFLILDPTSLIFDAAFQLRVHLDPAHPMARVSHPRALELLNRADTEQDPRCPGGDSPGDPDDRLRAGPDDPSLPGRGPLCGARPCDRLHGVQGHDPASRERRAAVKTSETGGELVSEEGAADAAPVPSVTLKGDRRG